MKNAIILFVYKQPELINIFLRQLLASTNMDIYVHINRKFDSLRHDIIQDDRIFVSNKNLPANWGDDGLCLAINMMLHEVVSSGVSYNHVIFASGQDLLVKKDIDDYLDCNKHQIFFNVRKEDNKFARAVLLNYWPNYYKQRLDCKIHPLRIARALRIKLIMAGCNIWRKSVNYDAASIEFYHSTFWGSMPFVVAQWIVSFIDNSPSFLDIFKGSFLAEEKFIGTLIMMSPYNGWLIFDENGKSHSLTYTNIITNNHPPVLCFEDIPNIEKSDLFFARKFDLNFDCNVVQYFYNKITRQI